MHGIGDERLHLVFAGNEFKTALDVKLIHCYLHVCLYNSYNVILHGPLTQNLLLTMC